MWIQKWGFDSPPAHIYRLVVEMEYTSDLRSDAVRIEGSNPSWSTIKEIMQFERVTSRNWYTHLIANQTPFGIVGSSPTNTLLLILISFYFR